jgi:hypothetical protein
VICIIHPKASIIEFSRHLFALNTIYYLCLVKYLNYFCRFRNCNVKRPIQEGRWFNILRENRTSNSCSKNEIGDEHLYLFNCNDSCILQSRLSNTSKYSHPNVYKFEESFKTHKKK